MCVWGGGGGGGGRRVEWWGIGVPNWGGGLKHCPVG